MRKKENEQPEEAVNDVQPVEAKGEAKEESVKEAVKKEPKEVKYLTVRELANEAGTPEEIYEGVKVANGWKDGKAVSKEEYNAAVREFSEAPADGRKKEDKN